MTPSLLGKSRYLPCSAMSIRGARIRLHPEKDGIRLTVIGPNGGTLADELVRSDEGLRVLARGFAEASPAEIIDLASRR